MERCSNLALQTQIVQLLQDFKAKAFLIRNLRILIYPSPLLFFVLYDISKKSFSGHIFFYLSSGTINDIEFLRFVVFELRIF